MKYKLKADSTSINIYEIQTPKEPTKANPNCEPRDVAIKFYGTIQQAAIGLRDLLVHEKLEPLPEINTPAILAAVNASTKEVLGAIKEYHETK